MKICAISYHSCPYSLLGSEANGGMSVYLRELSSVLARNSSVEVDIFTRLQDAGETGITHLSPSIRVIRIDAGPVRELDRTKVFDFLPEFISNLEDFICREGRKYDVLYTHYWLSGLVGDWVKQNHFLPLVHTYHTLAFFKERVLGKSEQMIRRMAEEHIARAADMIISSSKVEKNWLSETFGIPPSKVRVIHPGVNDRLFRPVDPGADPIISRRPEDLVLLYVGRIDPIKGLMSVVEPLRLLREEDPGLYGRLKLVVVGGGRREADLPRNREAVAIRRRLDEEEMSDKVVFLGSRPQEELPSFYSTADALLVPSLYESFGLVVVEALACGTPVLVSDVGEGATFVKEGKNGFVFSPRNPRSMADAVRRLDGRRSRLWSGQKIRKTVLRQVSWERTAAEVCRVLTELTGRRDCSTTISQPGENPQPA